MGGIPTNIKRKCDTDGDNPDKVVTGLMAIGEAACVSVHVRIDWVQIRYWI